MNDQHACKARRERQAQGLPAGPVRVQQAEDLLTEYLHAYADAQFAAAAHIWASIHRHNGDPRGQYVLKPGDVLAEIVT